MTTASTSRRLRTLTLLLLCCLARTAAPAADAPPAPAGHNPDLLTKVWSAKWVSVPGAPPFDYGVYHFRRTFDLKGAPSSFVVHASGDNRYQLYVNGRRVLWGPARGDLHHWRYETVDLAPHLKAGRNVLAAVVWNYGHLAPEAQVTNQTAFILQGDTEAERVVDTGPAWKCSRNEAYAPLPVTHGEMRGYFVAGPGERLTADRYPWGWESAGFDDSAWSAAQPLTNGAPRAAQDAPNRWMLVPRSIPLMEERPERLSRVRRSEGVDVPASFPREAAPLRVPARTSARLLLDQGHLTTAYPELVVSGGRGATASLRYAESLVIPGDYEGHFRKGHRDEIEGKVLVGYGDTFVADGGAKRLFRPLWWRTYRYVELSVETGDDPLVVEDLRGVFTAYPFERKATFDAGSERLARILDVGWRTARLCAHETYVDCPYYEQLQYAGDTRIQALVSLYTTGDDRLVRNAIAQLDASRTSEGLTQSRAPTRLQQYIPPFSLWWVGMVHDYWMYRDDPEFVRRMLPGVRAVLSFFASRQKRSGSLGLLPWWNFVDWARPWAAGVPPATASGDSAPLDLQLLLAYGWAAEMEEALGSKALAGEHREAAARLRAAAQGLYWDESRRLYADTPRKASHSQQTNALAVLAGLAEGEAARDLVRRTLSDGSLVQSSIYFRHYLYSAVNRAGEGDRYLELLGEWDAMLARGLTTWAETADPARSDCHAWGASPNFELFRTVLGIDSAAPGFRRVRIRPFPGGLKEVSGSIPHPRGVVAVHLSLRGGGLAAEVTLPAGVTGEFVWRERRRELPSGKTRLTL